MASQTPRPARGRGTAPRPREGAAPADSADPTGTAATGTADQTGVAEILAAAREQAVRDLAELTGTYDDLVSASQLSNADDEHDPEGVTIASERSRLDALVRAARNRLAEVDAAAARLAQGQYGICTVCGRPIARARLEARPVARTCIECAARPT